MLEYSKYWHGFSVHLFWVLGDEVIYKKYLLIFSNVILVSLYQCYLYQFSVNVIEYLFIIWYCQMFKWDMVCCIWSIFLYLRMNINGKEWWLYLILSFFEWCRTLKVMHEYRRIYSDGLIKKEGFNDYKVEM